MDSEYRLFLHPVARPVGLWSTPLLSLPPFFHPICRCWLVISEFGGVAELISLFFELADCRRGLGTVSAKGALVGSSTRNADPVPVARVRTFSRAGLCVSQPRR